jgi:hypothetical protein
MGAKHYIFASKIGISAPAATGMRPVLYEKAQKRFCLNFDTVVSTKMKCYHGTPKIALYQYDPARLFCNISSGTYGDS